MDLIFHPVAFALDEDGFGMMEQSVEDGGGEGGIVVEDLGPVFEGPVLCGVHRYAERSILKYGDNAVISVE